MRNPTLFNFQILEAPSTRVDFNSIVQHYFKPNSSDFMRERPMKQISFSARFTIFYAVYLKKKNYLRFISRYTFDIRSFLKENNNTIILLNIKMSCNERTIAIMIRIVYLYSI